MYGREPPLPTFVDVDKLTVSDKDLQKYFEGAKTRSKEVYDEARRRMIENRAKEVEAYNKKAKHDPLTPGEKVYELIPPSTRDKLQPKWDNLMTVKSRRPSRNGNEGTTYICQRPDGTTCTRNYEQLKRSNVHKPDPCILPAQQKATPNLPTPPDQSQHTLLDPLPPTPALTSPLTNKTQKPIIKHQPLGTEPYLYAIACRPTQPPPQPPVVPQAAPPLGVPMPMVPLAPANQPATVVSVTQPTAVIVPKYASTVTTALHNTCNP